MTQLQVHGDELAVDGEIVHWRQQTQITVQHAADFVEFGLANAGNAGTQIGRLQLAGPDLLLELAIDARMEEPLPVF